MEYTEVPPLDDLDAMQDWLDRQRARQAGASLNYVVAARLRVHTMRRRIKQQEIADALGEAQPWVSRKLRGQSPITLDELDRLATAVGVSVIDLLPERLKTPTDGYVPRYIARSALGLAA